MLKLLELERRKLWGERRGLRHHRCADIDGGPHGQPYDLSKPLVALDHDSTLVCVIEMSGSSWLVAGTVPGVSRRPLQKLPVDPGRLLDQCRRRVNAPQIGRSKIPQVTQLSGLQSIDC